MKKFIVILLSNFIFTISFAQTDAAYRIFGEIMTVENKVYKGFITWNGNKNYWIDFFEASKIENPYRSYFKRSDGLVFRANDREFITPPTHNFCCRFGNIKSIRLFSYNHGEIPFVGKHIILASGSYFSQGLIATSERVYEPVFDLDVTYPEDRNQWYGRNAFDRQPYEGFGVKTGTDFRGMVHGQVLENLYVAGAVLEGFNPIKEGCGGGVSVLSALYVAEQILSK